VFRKKRHEEILGHTRENREEVLASETCVCLKCCSTFSPDEITDWTGEDRHHHHKREQSPTAVCPHCGEATVIGDRSGLKVSPATMEALRSRMRVS
jgi:hypothetical protein